MGEKSCLFLFYLKQNKLRLRLFWSRRRFFNTVKFTQKKEPDSLESSSEKKSGIELLSHSQICSTIVAGPLIDRVRDGNVSDKPAMDTGKKGLKMLGLCRIVGLYCSTSNCSKLGNCDFVFENAACCFFRSNVLADIGRKKRWSSLTTG